ncbi:replication initiator [Streptomyces sp. NPDC007025]|uniref:replication initiator n=1 Tax=Streptomyces sp. NPDC007025 TaxID=3364771 RepID=UPI0036B6652A
MYPTDETRRSVLEGAERLRRLTPTERDIIRLAHEPGFPRWLEQIRTTGGCEHPVYLAGHSTTRDSSSGEILRHYSTQNEPGGRMPVRCRNRRASRCEPCSRLHAGDTFHLVRAGLSGGKGVPEHVRLSPRVFVTLTAPSFGPVHRVTEDGVLCRPRRDGIACEHGYRLDCRQQHGPQDAAAGQPLCRACYDYIGHVLWHAHAGRLWNRWVHTVRRHLASAGGIAQTRLREHLVVSFAKVAEYQRRGAVHFHAVVRLDGPHGPESPRPAWAKIEILTEAVRSAAAAVAVFSAHSPATGDYVIRWGREIDVHSIQSDAFTDATVTDSAVAAYVAKYITKSVGDAGGLDHRVREYEEIRLAAVTPHIRALMVTCWRLGTLAELTHLRLRAWAHTLGYRGHALTKSRHYSTTYGTLRAARTTHQTGTTDDTGTDTEAAWRYVGSGHTPGEAEITRGIAADLSALRDSSKYLGAEGGNRAT